MTDIVTIFLDNGADLFVKMADEESPLEYAVEKSNNAMSRRLLRHLALLTESGGCNDSRRRVIRIVGMVAGNGRLPFYEKHRREIINMKAEKIYKNISYFDVFKRSVEWIGSMARNAEFVEAFNDSRVTKKFPFYGKIVKKRFEDAVKIMDLTEEAIEYLSMLFSDMNLPIPIFETIVKYYELKDLEKFVKSCQELN